MQVRTDAEALKQGDIVETQPMQLHQLHLPV